MTAAPHSVAKKGDTQELEYPENWLSESQWQQTTDVPVDKSVILMWAHVCRTINLDNPSEKTSGRIR